MSYAELQVTSNFSFRLGGSHPEELIDTAADLGYTAIALTDRNTFAGVVRAYVVAKDRGIKFIPAVRLDLLDGPSLLAYPTDQAAYSRLSGLLTLGNLRAEKEKCYLNKQDVYEHSEGSIFVLIPPQSITADFELPKKFKTEVAEYRQNIKDLYIAASRTFTDGDAKRLFLLSELGIPMVATNDVHYHDPSRRELQDVLTCVRAKRTIFNAGYLLHQNAERYLKDGKETTDILVVAVDVTAQVHARNEVQQINVEIAAANEELRTTNDELTAIQQRYEETNLQLENSASRLQMAIESTGLGTWEYAPQSGDLYWSKECREIYGIPDNEEPSFTAFTNHIYHDDRHGVETAIQKAIDPSGSGRYDLNFRITRFDTGEPRWVRAQGRVYFQGGQALRFFGTVVDIHELKDAEEKSAKLAAIIATSDDAIISKTLEGVITSWNASANRVFGYEAEEMIGESIYKLIPPERYEEEPYILATLKKGKRIDHFETKRLTKDGRLIDVSVTVSPVMDKENRIIGVSKIARDITEKKLNETRKSDFIGMVSHELKTPLTSLSAIIQVANIKLQDSEDRFLAGAMDKANLQVSRMSALINGFLNISRLDSGKLHMTNNNFTWKRLFTK